MTDVALGRRERKKEETKRRIFETAIKLFADKGFQATTVDEIAEAADVAKGTFFNYFPRKEAIVHFLFEEWTEIGEQLIAERDRSAEERIVEMFTTAARSFGETRELASTVARFALQEMCAPDMEDTHRRHDLLFEQLWLQGVESGELRSEVDPKHAMGVLGSVFVGAVTWWVGSPSGYVDPEALKYELHEVIRANVSLVFDGLRPGKAR